MYLTVQSSITMKQKRAFFHAEIHVHSQVFRFINMFKDGHENIVLSFFSLWVSIFQVHQTSIYQQINEFVDIIRKSTM